MTAYGLRRAIPGQPPARERAQEWTSVAVNSGLLAVFKYADFFLSGTAQAMEAVGLPLASPAQRLPLPLGISIYSYQGIAYTTAIYRQKAQPARSWLHVAAYLAFFPK